MVAGPVWSPTLPPKPSSPSELDAPTSCGQTGSCSSTRSSASTPQRSWSRGGSAPSRLEDGREDDDVSDEDEDGEEEEREEEEERCKEEQRKDGGEEGEAAELARSRPRTGSSQTAAAPAPMCIRPSTGRSVADGGLRLPAIVGRAPSLGAVGRGGLTKARLTLTVTAKFEGAEVAVDLAEGELDRGCAGLPDTLPEGQPVTIELRSSGAIVGALRVSGVPPIPFGVQARPSAPRASGGLAGPAGTERVNFVSAEHRQRSVVAGAENLEFGSGMGAKGEGTVVEVMVGPGSRAEMSVVVRRAKKKELARLAQEQALVSAMEQKKYSTLIAQIARAKMRKVEASLIDQAGRVLKSIQPSETTFLSHRELSKLMRWRRVTAPAGGTCDEHQPCALDPDCPCNAGQAQDGEICDVINDMVDKALEGVAPASASADKWLFQALVRAALLAPEGCVWKSGGKYLLTNEERNQSPTAIVSVLERENPDSDAGRGIRALVAHTEREFGFRVTAIQLNFHPNNRSSHKQHRDIYGAGQKGGINCTCSFMKCTGTVCYSLGSSRQVLTETIADTRSKYEPCSEECTGSKRFRWMHSGSAMYFNAPFNNNHTHGVPELEEACGPRISVALLCA